MTDRPIIFSGPMVRALLDGRKTQTRRLASSPLRRCQVGDRLYVRENFALECDVDGDLQPLPFSDGRPVKRWETIEDGRRWVQAHYAATDPKPILCDHDGEEVSRWRPSIHMPRWASRLTLIVEAVRFQRLQEISEEDAIAEGAAKLCWDGEGTWFEHDANGTYRCGFAGLWAHLHGAESWDDNPEIVALTFRVARANIDAIDKEPLP